MNELVALVVLAVAVGVVVWWFGGRLVGVPKPPRVRHDPACESGVYSFRVVKVWRGRPLWTVAVKVGKSAAVDVRLSGHVTLEDRRIVDERLIRTADYDELERRIHRDLARWRLPGVRARELYRPYAWQVRWYLRRLVARSRR